MRKITLAAHKASRSLSAAQGLAGVACLAAGAYIVAGLGIALLVLGGFLLVGAWGSR